MLANFDKAQYNLDLQNTVDLSFIDYIIYLLLTVCADALCRTRNCSYVL